MNNEIIAGMLAVVVLLQASCVSGPSYEEQAEAARREQQREQQEQRQEVKLAELIREGDRYFADGKKDWEEEKSYTGNWSNWRRDSVNFLRRATEKYNEVLKTDPNNAQAQQRIANVRQLEAEIQAADKQGFVSLKSDIAGVVLLNGEQTNFSVAADSSVRIVIDNANGEYTLAVKDGTGKVFPALGKITINGTGLRNTYSSMVFNPNPAPNSGDDFNIRQNAQGGITITGYSGKRQQVVIPDTISGIKVTEIGVGAFSHERKETSGGYQNINGMDVRVTNVSYNSGLVYTVVIPNTVTVMGEDAFKDQTTLKSVVLSNYCAVIPKQAFYNCALETVTIPNSVTAIGEAAFAKNQLTSVTFGNRVVEIGINAFAANNFTELKNLPASLRSIHKNAFANNAINTLVIPNGVTILWADCFVNNPIATLVIPPSLAGLRKQPSGTWYVRDEFYVAGFALAFAKNKDPTAITLPANVDDENLDRNFSSTFLDFYKSQNKKAGTYSFDGRLWTVK